MEVLAQRDSVDKFHGDEVRPVTLTNLVNVCNVRMIERCRSRRFLFEGRIRSELAAISEGRTIRATLRWSLESSAR
jgi:hypothetical protein